MKPSIQTEIEKLQQTKEENRIAIMEKGVTVYGNDLYSSYPTRISQITMTPGDKDDIIGALIDRSVTSFEIPYGTTLIGYSAFQNCPSLTSVTIPDSVTTIGNAAFFYCSSLTSVTIPDSVTTIGQFAFAHCSSLTSVTIPSGVTSIGQGTFDGCTSFTSVTVNATTPPTLGGDYAFDHTGDCPIYVPDDSVDVYKAAWTKYASRIQAKPQDNTLFNSIVDRSVTSISIPDSTTSIGDYAFINCTSLSSVTIPNSVTSIRSNAFNYCQALASVNIPSSVTTIGEYAFYNCTSLTSITVEAATPPTLGTRAFDNASDSLVIYVPFSSLKIYKTATNWKTYADRIQTIPS